ncbi:MAG: hypothetical protein EXR98_23140 [Gemmataceae bacterium]|nr:hypothetical protein [Gemmataceae bacterium]
MIRMLSECPYCTTHIAYDWHTKTAIFNPDTGLPVCNHVVWVDGVLRMAPEDNIQSRTNFRWIHPQFGDLDSNAELREYLGDIEVAESEMIPFVKFDGNWKCELPTIDDPSGLLDAIVIFAADPQAFLDACLLDIEKNPRPQERGPFSDWWRHFSGDVTGE